MKRKSFRHSADDHRAAASKNNKNKKHINSSRLFHFDPYDSFLQVRFKYIQWFMIYFNTHVVVQLFIVHSNSVLILVSLIVPTMYIQGTISLNCVIHLFSMSCSFLFLLAFGLKKVNHSFCLLLVFSYKMLQVEAKLDTFVRTMS